MKKFLAALSLVTVLVTVSFTTSQSALPQLNGQAQGIINQLEAQGWTLTDISFAPINYLVAPTPPYQNGTYTVTLRKIECTSPDGPCALLGTAVFTVEEWVVNNNGNTVLKNVSDVLVAL